MLIKINENISILDEKLVRVKSNTEVYEGGFYESGWYWAGSAVLCDGGNKVFFPHGSYRYASLLDLNSMTMETFSDLGTSYHKFYWTGGVLAPNGQIYCIPANTRTTGSRFDINAKTAVNFGSFASTDIKYTGGLLVQNGFLYWFSGNVGNIPRVNYANNTVSLLTPTFTQPPFHHPQSVSPRLHSNGKIYLAPLANPFMSEYDPISNTETPFGSNFGPQLSKWGGSVIVGNKMYSVPFHHTRVMVANLETKETYLIGPTVGTPDVSNWSYLRPTLATDGKIYCFPFIGTSRILVIDPATENVYFIGLPKSEFKSKNPSQMYFVKTLQLPDGRLLGCGEAPVTFLDLNLPPLPYPGIPANLADLPTSDYNKYYNVS